MIKKMKTDINMNSSVITLGFFIILYYPHVIINLLCRSIFSYFYFKIITNPILDYTYINLEELNRFNIELLLIVVSGVSACIGFKLFNWLKKVVLNLYNTTYNNNSNNTILKANVGLLGLLSAVTNTSAASKFHTKRALDLKQEETLLAIVVPKLDQEQPLSNGCSRWASIQEYIGDLRRGVVHSERFAYRNYYRDVVMGEIFNDTSSVSSVVSSVASSIF